MTHNAFKIWQTLLQDLGTPFICAVGALTVLAGIVMAMDGWIKNRQSPLALVKTHRFLGQRIAHFFGYFSIVKDEGGKPLWLASYLVVSGCLAGISVIPLGYKLAISHWNVGIFSVTAFLSLLTAGLMLIGVDRFDLRNIRALRWVVCFEIPAMCSLLVPAMLAGSLRIQTLVEAQQGGYGIANWFIFHNPFAFFSFLTYIAASSMGHLWISAWIGEDLTPLKTVIHPSDSTDPQPLKAREESILKMAAYGRIWVISAIASCVFLGGWQTPFLDVQMNPPDWMTYILGSILWFLFKTFPLAFVILWVCSMITKFRIHQRWGFVAEFLVSFSLLNMIGSSLWLIVAQGQGLSRILFGSF